MKRTLCVMLALMLCWNAVPAWSEDEVFSENVEAAVQPADYALDSGLTVEWGEPIVELPEGEDDSPGDDSAAEDSLPQLPEGGPFYAMTVEAAQASTESGRVYTLPEGAVVLAIPENTGETEWAVTFEAEGQQVIALMDCGALAPLTTAEAASLMDEISASDGVLLYENRLEWPLPCPDSALDEATGLVELEAEDVDDSHIEPVVSEVSDSPDAAPVTISVGSVTIGVGEVYEQLTARVIDAHGHLVTDANVIWSSSDVNVARIRAATGVLTGVGVGHATITAFVDEIGEATVEVTVKNAPTSVAFPQSALKLGVGMTCAMQPSFGGDGHSNALTWTSSRPAVASIDAAGVVTALAVGSTNITVRTFNGKTATCSVTVGKAPARVQMNATMVLGLGQRAMLHAVAQDEDGAETGGGLSYTTEQSCIDLNSETGEVVARSLGVATVRARAFNGVYAVCEVRVVRAPAAIRMNAQSLSIGVRETSSALKIRLVPPAGALSCASEVEWQSSNASVARVDARTGAITGVKAGRAVITATTHNQHSVSAEVTVKSAPSSIRFGAQEVRLSEGMTMRLTGTVSGGVSSSGLTWTSSNTNVATVDAMGNVTGVGTGHANITVRTFNGLSATCKVIVTGAPSKLELAQTEIMLVMGQQATIAPVVLDAGNNATVADYTYSILVDSENPDCLSVSGDGTITPVSSGSAVVGVTTHNGLKARCRVRVEAAPEAIELGASELTLGVRETVQAPEVRLIPPEGERECTAVIAWSSSNASVAKVNAQTGAITGVKTGTVTVTAQTHNGKSATLTVRVKSAPTSLRLNPNSVELTCGMSLALGVTFNSGAYGGVSWSTDNAQVATVNADGEVTAMGLGTAVITGRTYNGITATCNVTVIDEPFDLILEETHIEMLEGQTHALRARVLDVDDRATVAGYAYRVYSSTQPVCVSVDAATGEITALRRGRAVVQVTTQNGLEATCAVSVRAAPEAIELTPGPIAIGLNEVYEGLEVRLIPHADETEAEAVLTWSTSNASIVRVNAETGAIQGARTGSATITVRTHNGLEQSVDITVRAAPTSLTLSPKRMELLNGTTARLTASLNSGAASGLIRYTSTNPEVIEALPGGEIRAVGKGNAVVTAVTFNGKSDTCEIHVYEAPDQVFIAEQLNLAVGMSRRLEPSVLDSQGDVSFAEYSFTVLDGADSIAVDDNGVVTAVRRGTARVRVATNGGLSTHVSILDGRRVETVCTVTVSDAPARIELPESIEIDVGESRRMEPVLYTSDNAVTHVGDYTMTLSGNAASLSDDGTVTGRQIGTAVLTATTYNGIQASCTLHVIAQRYRLFTACSYADPTVRGGLYFTEHNILSMKQAFGETHVDGVRYEMLGSLVNPSKSALLNSLRNSFADSIYTDVNIVYLCSHGINYVDVDAESYRRTHGGQNPPTHYGLQLPGYTDWSSPARYYITAEEIFEAIQPINGRVILILDSCYSGEFITNMRERLDAENGRISVLTAASNTKASYYVVKDRTQAFDFFTYYLLLGVGFDEYYNIFDGNFGADANGDGKVTLREFFNYGHREVTAHLPEFADQSWFHGDAAQTPRFYAGNNGSTVIYTRVEPS